MQQLLDIGLSSQELCASVIAMCIVGLAYLVQDAVRDDISDNGKIWRWGDAHRRPTPAPTWGDHRNCALLSALFVTVTLALVIR